MNEIIKKNGISFGIILGVFSILVTTLIYVIDLKLFMNTWVGIISLVIYVILGVVLVSKTKKQLGNLISFKDAFTVFFIAAVIGSTLSVLFNIVLFNYVDPAAKETIRELTMDYSIATMEKFGAKPDDAMIEKLQNTDNYAPGSQLMGLVFSFIFFFKSSNFTQKEVYFSSPCFR